MKAPVLHFSFSSDKGSHQCRLEYDWLGSERYYIDDILVLKQWSLLNSTAKLSFNGVQIAIDNRLVRLRPITEVRINGRLINSNLMEDDNKQFEEKLEQFFGPKPTLQSWLIKVIIWAAIGFMSYAAFRWVAKHAA
jgi:hypothetical protein